MSNPNRSEDKQHQGKKSVGSMTVDTLLALVELLGATAEKLAGASVRVILAAYLVSTVWTAKFGHDPPKVVEAAPDTGSQRLTVSIHDAHGNPVPAAEMTVVDLTRGTELVLRSDRTGLIETPFRGAGIYEIRYPPGDGSLIRFRVPLEKSVTLTVILEPLERAQPLPTRSLR